MGRSNKLLSWMTGLCACLLMVACNAFHEGEGDCELPSPEVDERDFLVTFRYDWNLKSADAFAAEVKAVTLYLIAPDGTVVWTGTERGDALAADGYCMRVDVDPGTYELLAWCTTNDQNSYTMGQGPRKESLTCTMNRTTDELGEAIIDQDIDDLYYGHRESVEFLDEPGTQTVQLPLMKNTNRVRVVLQNAYGNEIDKDLFKVTLTDDHGSMDYQNNLLADETLTYSPWHITAGTAEVGESSEATEGGTEEVGKGLNVWMAEFHIGRLMTDHNPRITVVNQSTGNTVFSVPLVDYALLLKGYERSDMDDQEYLDRQDEYNMVFFLDDNNRWITNYIYINSWRIVLLSGQL